MIRRARERSLVHYRPEVSSSTLTWPPELKTAPTVYTRQLTPNGWWICRLPSVKDLLLATETPDRFRFKPFPKRLLVGRKHNTATPLRLGQFLFLSVACSLFVPYFVCVCGKWGGLWVRAYVIASVCCLDYRFFKRQSVSWFSVEPLFKKTNKRNKRNHS